MADLTSMEARVLWHLEGLDHTSLESVRDTSTYPATQRYTLHYGPEHARRSLRFEEGTLARLVNRGLLEPYAVNFAAGTWKLRATEAGRQLLREHQEVSQAGKPSQLPH